MSKGIYKTMNVGNVLTYDENSVWLCDSITLAKNGNIIFGGYIFCRYLADGYDEECTYKIKVNDVSYNCDTSNADNYVNLFYMVTDQKLADNLLIENHDLLAYLSYDEYLDFLLFEMDVIYYNKFCREVDETSIHNGGIYTCPARTLRGDLIKDGGDITFYCITAVNTAATAVIRGYSVDSNGIGTPVSWVIRTDEEKAAFKFVKQIPIETYHIYRELYRHRSTYRFFD